MSENVVEIKIAATILLADSDVLVRMPIAAFLRDCGYRVVEAADGDEAILVLDAGDPQIDVVLADVELAGRLNGFGLKKWLSEHRPHLKIILAGTPKQSTTAAGELCEEGPQLKKPYHPQTVHDHVRHLLAARDRSATSSEKSRTET